MHIPTQQPSFDEDFPFLQQLICAHAQGEAIKPFVVALDRFGWLVEGKPVAYTRKKMGYAGFEPGRIFWKCTCLSECGIQDLQMPRGFAVPDAAIACVLASGASITISVSTERGNPDPNAVVAVQLAYLRSYEHMGVGRAR
eukprot:352421-Chlamydomonas_euryale.AAC.55